MSAAPPSYVVEADAAYDTHARRLFAIARARRKARPRWERVLRRCVGAPCRAALSVIVKVDPHDDLRFLSDLFFLLDDLAHRTDPSLEDDVLKLLLEEDDAGAALNARAAAHARWDDEEEKSEDQS